MRIVKLPKKNGSFRTIYVPTIEEKAKLSAVKHEIERRVQNQKCKDVIHGFVRGKSSVTNAMSHVGHKFTLTMDLKDFFDSVTELRLRGKISKELQDLCLVDGAARQGLPTSPAMANLAATDIDKAILKLFGKHKLQVVYTRYADDLTFSFNEREVASLLLTEIPKIVTRSGFKIATEKTHLYESSKGRRIITGIAVDDSLHPTRGTKRKLRAALHQKRLNQANGLREWMRLKTPQARNSNLITHDGMLDEVNSVAKAWGLRNLSATKMPDKGPDIDLGDNCIITGDPVMMLGMSTFTTGWTSCMNHPNGCHRRGTVFWTHLRGTRIAALLSDKTATHGGVTRNRMIARCLIHTLEDGRLVYDRIYGGQMQTLIDKLNAFGAISMAQARAKPGRVVGHAPSKWKAWFDNLHSHTSIAKSGRWKGQKVRVCTLTK